jgi:hypothetical protein
MPTPKAFGVAPGEERCAGTSRSILRAVLRTTSASLRANQFRPVRVGRDEGRGGVFHCRRSAQGRRLRSGRTAARGSEEEAPVDGEEERTAPSTVVQRKAPARTTNTATCACSRRGRLRAK